MEGFISMTHINRNDLTRTIDEVTQMIIEGHKSIREDSDYLRKAKITLPGNNRTRTMVILGELFRGFTLDSSASISKNDVIDLMHAAMPINCCDYVLLDGPWVERVNKMKQRIERTGMIMPIAKCFSRKNNGVESFLADLETFSVPF
jgi:hypothetical protein